MADWAKTTRPIFFTQGKWLLVSEQTEDKDDAIPFGKNLKSAATLPIPLVVAPYP
jgi:hypothetical protein